MITTIALLVAILICIKPLYMGISWGIRYFAFTQQKNRLKNELNKYKVEKDIEENKKEIEKKVTSSTDKDIIDYFNK